MPTGPWPGGASLLGWRSSVGVAQPPVCRERCERSPSSPRSQARDASLPPRPRRASSPRRGEPPTRSRPPSSSSIPTPGLAGRSWPGRRPGPPTPRRSRRSPAAPRRTGSRRKAGTSTRSSQHAWRRSRPAAAFRFSSRTTFPGSTAPPTEARRAARPTSPGSGPFGQGSAPRRPSSSSSPTPCPCSTASHRPRRAERLRLIRAAARVLTTGGRIDVYLDAGHDRWQPVRVIAARLQAAGVRRVRGFSVNVANFGWTSRVRDFGRRVSARLGGAHFVIDTSRNGLGPTRDNAWCNPPGRALGEPPRAATGRLLDALLWVKQPGESDGTCEGGPPRRRSGGPSTRSGSLSARPAEDGVVPGEGARRRPRP